MCMDRIYYEIHEYYMVKSKDILNKEHPLHRLLKMLPLRRLQQDTGSIHKASNTN